MGSRRKPPPDPRSREGDWRSLLEVEPMALPLRPRDRRRLRLEVLWRRCAGEALAGRVTEVSARRGTLEVTFADARWAREAAGAVTQAAGRLCAAAPDLRLRRVRIRALEGPVETREVRADPDTAGRSAPTPRPRPRGSAGDGALTSSIEELAERYLRKARGRSSPR